MNFVCFHLAAYETQYVKYDPPEEQDKIILYYTKNKNCNVIIAKLGKYKCKNKEIIYRF